jgi:hypothetical protein
MSFLRRAITNTHCTIEIEHSQESLHAHVSLQDDLPLGPGDRVTIHGAPVKIAFGERMSLRRPATVERATPLERAWTRLMARFDLAELYEVSFSSGSRL